MYLIIGATGNVGSEVTKHLLAAGHDVRALIRSEARASTLPEGASFAVGDLDNADSLVEATRGVDGVFFMQLQPSPEQAQTFIDAVQSVGVNRVVVLSSVGTRLHPAPIIGGLIARRDSVFRASTLDVTYLYASGLTSNATWWADTIRTAGQVVDSTEPGKIGVVDPFDVGRVAATVLAETGHSGKGYLLTGPEALSPSEQTSILADVLGKALEYIDATPEEEAQKRREAGVPEFMVNARQNLDELFRAGRAGFLSDEVQNLTGTAPRSFRSWVQEHTDLFA